MTTNLSAIMNATATDMANGTWTNFVTVADSDGAASAVVPELIQIGPVTSPVLTVTLTNQQALLSWSEIASSSHLDATTNLVPPSSWSTVTNTPLPVNGQNTVSLPAGEQQRFFRLHSP